ncbi:MAG: hypothetical protein LUQ12_05245 [Methanoregulaceae archaeon]|nr:hypothetical protein [Methanoregulaceae archaeon]
MNSKQSLFILLAVMIGLLLSSGCVSYLQAHLPPAAYPEIRPVQGATLLTNPEYTFDFADFQVSISSPVDPDVYSGARSAEKEVRIYDNSISDDEWRSGFYRTMTTDPAQDPFFEDLASEFREIRSGYNLDSDEYLELMGVFVQSLPYKNQNLSSPKYPIETYIDGEGDCDDKSMLLAGLLAHEGYGVALLYFGPEKHMAVGVACPGEGYRNTGYAYLETTRVSLVGNEAGSLVGNITLTSEPLVIPIGDGTVRYMRCNETRAIYAELIHLREQLESLGTDLRDREDALETKKSDLVAMEGVIEQIRNNGDISGYNRMVSEYNKKVRDYNQNLDQYNEISGEYARLAERHNYIISHEHDRAGIYLTLSGTV